MHLAEQQARYARFWPGQDVWISRVSDAGSVCTVTMGSWGPEGLACISTVSLSGAGTGRLEVMYL